MSPSKRQSIPVQHDVNPLLEHDDERGAPERGLTAPVMLPSAAPVTVALRVDDALIAGMTMRSLVHANTIEPVTADVFERVGKALIEAATASAKTLGVAR